MDIARIMPPELISWQSEENTNKKQILKTVSALVSALDEAIKYPDILEALQQREKLGSTTIGYGVAIPHARVKNLKKALCALITLKMPIDFDSADESDKTPVDVIFALIVPEEPTQTDLDILPEIAARLKDEAFRIDLRKAKNKNELYNVAIDTLSLPQKSDP